MLCNRRSIRRCLALMLVLALPLCAAVRSGADTALRGWCAIRRCASI